MLQVKSRPPSRPVRSRPSPTPPKAQPPSDELLEGKGWHFNRFGLLDPRAKAKEELVPEGNEELVPMDVSTGSASGPSEQPTGSASGPAEPACGGSELAGGGSEPAGGGSGALRHVDASAQSQKPASSSSEPAGGGSGAETEAAVGVCKDVSSLRSPLQVPLCLR